MSNMADFITDSDVEGTRFPNWQTISGKEEELNRVLLERFDGAVRVLLEKLLYDEDVHVYHSYANVVSVRRLGYNDHGPVHARLVTYNALKLLKLLQQHGVKVSLEAEEVAGYEEAQVAVALGAFLHDIGMGVTRQNHEWHSIQLADPIIRTYLADLYPEDRVLRHVLRAMTHEAIVGHMANERVHSIEAGVVLVADGCDMAHGRSRIPQALERDPMVGDIHRFSASAIRRVDIRAGSTKPAAIHVEMDNVTGLFQVEEILMTKVKASPIMSFLEVAAVVGQDPPRHYLS